MPTSPATVIIVNASHSSLAVEIRMSTLRRGINASATIKQMSEAYGPGEGKE